MKSKTVAMILAGAMIALGSLNPANAGDRVNLWPLLYDDGDGTYVAWPFARFSDSGKSWIFPTVWDKDEFYIFPEVWINKHVVAVLPLIVDTDGDGFAIFPLLWNDWGGSGFKSCLFPAYYFGKNDYHTHFWSMAGLLGYWRDGKDGEGDLAHWLLPLYAKDDDGFYSIPYSHTKGSVFFLCGLAGNGWGEDGASWMVPFYYKKGDTFVTPLFGWTADESWCFPLFYRDKDEFLSLPYSRSRTSEKYLLGLAGRMYGHDGTGDANWIFPFYFQRDDLFMTPLFGWTDKYSWAFPLYYRDDDGFYSFPYTRTKDEELYLLGLAGRTYGKKGDSKWFFPLFYQNDDTWIAPLFGQSKDASWVIPFFYSDKRDTITLPAAWGRRGMGSRYVFSLPLLSYYEWNENSDNYEWFALCGIAGAEKHGARSSQWLMPLFYSETRRDESMFATLPFGRLADGGQTNTWWVTPLVGTKSGKETGGWLFPLFSHEANPEYDRHLAWMDAKTLPEELNIRHVVETNTEFVAKGVYKTNIVERLDADYFRSRNDTTVMIVSGVDNSVSGNRSYFREKGADGRERDIYNIRSRSESGNIFVLKNTFRRSVDFDMETRRRIDESESTESDTSLFVFLYRSERSKSKDKSLSHSRILWKIWDREEKDGNVTVDAFPGFTYDSKTNGYEKTSFLWRFFRCEKDPEKNSTAVDLFFIPVWR